MATRLTSHFTLEELTRSDVAERNKLDNLSLGELYIDNLRYLAIMLEIIRSKYNMPIRISSGFRCLALNSLVGGSRYSNHLIGLAVDINQGSKVANAELFGFISSLRNVLPINELINENDFDWIHLSFYKL